ncbi:MAG: carboxymuconolactone decarboxylase family protein [SAR202 cluster bacterium]|nr:carboxymuconolactone decarboxylase family protein [SAR202 cluster bacterium]
MARIPLATRESVPATQREAFDTMLQSLKSVPRTGPGSVLIHVPEAHRILTDLNHYLRDSSTLSKKVQELAMLVTARENDCQHIWNAHAASAREAGVPSALVDALRDRKELPKMAADEAAVVTYGREFFRTHRVSRGGFQSAMEVFGRQGLVELTALLGNYALLAFMCNAFDTDLLAERKEPLLPV